MLTARIVAALGAAGAGLVTAVPAASAAPATSGAGEVVQTADLLPGLSHVPAAGHVDLAQVVQVTVALGHPDSAGESALLSAMYTKGSPDYHRFLTPAQYAAQFGVSAATYDTALKELTALGMSAVYQAPTRTIITLQGSLSSVESTFKVSLGEFKEPNGTLFYANTNAPTVPASVSRVLGLNSIAAFLAPQTAQTLCAPAGGVCIGAVTPQELWSVYDQPASDMGQGEKIGVIGAGDYVQPEKDLRQFESEFDLPKVDVVAHNVADDLTYTSGEGEWALDSEASTGMAPDVENLNYYFGEALGDADAYATWVNDPTGPTQANNSFGGCEALDLALGEPAVDDPLFEQADLEGRTLFVSTGDTGGSCTVVTGNGFLNTGAPQVEYPSSSPYVTAVGGTVLYTSGSTPDSRVSEIGWSHTGGGTSTMEARPAWQDGVNDTTTGTPGVTEPGVCVTDDQANPVSGDVPCRGVPDVAALSGDITVLTEAAGRQYSGNGYQDVEGGSDGADGGTSLASPLWVGMWTRMQAASKSGLGFAPPNLYNLAYNATSDPADFYNVAVGTNGQWRDNPTSPLDPTGWSYVSGLGVPNVGPMITTLDGTTTPADATAPFGGGTFDVVLPSTTGPGADCTNGVVTSTTPAGEIDGVGPNDPSEDMTQVVTTYDPTANAITWTATVQNLSANPQTGKAFAFQFTDGTTVYQAFAQTDTTGNEFELDSVASGPDGLVSTVTKLGPLTGTVDTAANTISVTLPLAEFNSDATGATPIAEGSVLTALNDQSMGEVGGQGITVEETLGYNQEISSACPYTVEPSGPASGQVPEAPFAILIGVAGLAVAGGTVAVRRRRRGQALVA